MSTNTRIPTGSSPNISQLERSLSDAALQSAQAAQTQAVNETYQLTADVQRALGRLRNKGIIPDIPFQLRQPDPVRTTGSSPLLGRLSGKSSTPPAPAPRVQAYRPSATLSTSAPNLSSRLRGGTATSPPSNGGSALLNRLSGQRQSPTGPAPTVQPYRPSSVPSSTAPGLSQRLAGVPPRTASAPNLPIPSTTPRLNPGRLTRAIEPVLGSARRVISPVANRLAPITRTISPVMRPIARALPYIGAGLDFAGGVSAGEGVGLAGAGALGSLGGGLAGAQAGAALGTLIFPGVGTAIGGVLGSLAGGFGGSWLGDRLYRRLFPNAGNNPLQNMHSPIDRGPAPPFYGGQSPGVPYDVRLTLEVRRVDDDSFFAMEETPWTGESPAVRIHGPIRRFFTNPRELVESSSRSVFIDYALYDGSPYTGFAYQTRDNFRYSIIRGIHIRRADEQPDTGGNPAPAPGAQPQTPLAPIVPRSPRVQPQVQPQSAPQPTGHPSNAPNSPLGPQIAPAPDPLQAPTPTATPNPVAAPGGLTFPYRMPSGLPSAPSGLPSWLPTVALPMGLPAIMPSSTGARGIAPSSIWRPSSTTTRSSSSTATGTGTPSSPTCGYDSLGISGKVDQANTSLNTMNTTMNAMNVLLNGAILGGIGTINTKLGAQIPNGGISGQLGKMFDFAKKTWNFLQIDRVLNILTYITVLHNAYMLSNNLGQTLFSAIGDALNIFNIQDADGGSLPIGEIVGQWTENFFKSVFGVETVDGIKEGWQKANRIYQATANLLFSLQSMIYSMVEILETISNYVGKIGNALQKSGTILQNSFNWMNQTANYTSNRFFNALNNAQEAVEAVANVASAVLSIQETGAEMANQKEEHDKAVAEGEKFVKDEFDEILKNTLKPNLNINPSDEVKAEVDES
jgi:hypothetical protein